MTIENSNSDSLHYTPFLTSNFPWLRIILSGQLSQSQLIPMKPLSFPLGMKVFRCFVFLCFLLLFCLNVWKSEVWKEPDGSHRFLLCEWKIGHNTLILARQAKFFPRFTLQFSLRCSWHGKICPVNESQSYFKQQLVYLTYVKDSFLSLRPPMNNILFKGPALLNPYCSENQSIDELKIYFIW